MPSLVAEQSGEKFWLQIAGTKYKCQGTLDINLAVRKADARGSGDPAARPKAIGLEDGAMIGAQCLSTDAAMLTFNGTEQTGCMVWNDTATYVGACTCFVEVSPKPNIAGMVQYDVKATLMTVPTPNTHLNY